MKNFILWTGIILVIGVGYVWQQSEMVKVSYDIRDSENRASLLLDQNRDLVYNVDRLESPGNLDKGLARNKMKFEMAGDRRVINVSGKIESANNEDTSEAHSFREGLVVQNMRDFLFQAIGGKESIIFNLFSIR